MNVYNVLCSYSVHIDIVLCCELLGPLVLLEMYLHAIFSVLLDDIKCFSTNSLYIALSPYTSIIMFEQPLPTMLPLLNLSVEITDIFPYRTLGVL